MRSTIGMGMLLVATALVVSGSAIAPSGLAVTLPEPATVSDVNAVARPVVRDTLVVTVVFDNMPYEEGLRTGWGYAAVVELRGQTVLFDTGAEGATLLENLRALGVEPRSITAVVLSHAHGDHTEGLDSLVALGTRPTVYVLPSFPNQLKAHVGERTLVREVSPGEEVVEGMYTTGEIGGVVSEQALVVRTNQGLVMLTGCAHPGVGTLVSRAKQLSGSSVYIVMGGFHLGSMPDHDVERVIGQLREEGVQYAAPSHCTGDRAVELFARAFGSRYLRSGVGRVIRLGD